MALRDAKEGAWTYGALCSELSGTARGLRPPHTARARPPLALRDDSLARLPRATGYPPACPHSPPASCAAADFFKDIVADPAVCLITWCLPCVTCESLIRSVLCT